MFLKVLSVQTERATHYILVKKPAKMTGEARNVAADWLCRTKARLLGIECMLLAVCFNNRRRRIIIRRRGRRNADGIPKRKSELSKHGTAAARVAGFTFASAWNPRMRRKLALSLRTNSNRFTNARFRSARVRQSGLSVCTESAPVRRGKAFQTYVKNETKSLLRVW